MLAVVVVSYNTRALLRDCLASVYRAFQRSGLRGQVWVVDNASADGSAEEVRAEFPDAHLIANPDNRGFAAANNQALQAMATDDDNAPDAVLLLNPDTEVLDDALDVMYRALMGQPDAGAVGARLVYPDGSFQHSAFRFPTLFQILLDFFPINHRLTDSVLNGRYPKSAYLAGRPFQIDHPLGAALMVRTETIRQVGRLDEQFFIYCEEIDWCMRIRRSGHSIWCVPTARIVHHAGQSTQQSRDRMFVALWRSRFLLFRKHYPPLFCWIARRIVAVAAWRERRQSAGKDRNDEAQGRAASFRSIREL